jgi:hypothetical protein
MRYLMYPASVAALAIVFLALPAQAAQYQHDPYAQLYAGEYPGSKAYGARPYWQGAPTDRLPIWRNGYYQGNDPDQFIRLQLMRDPTNGPKGK